MQRLCLGVHYATQQVSESHKGAYKKATGKAENGEWERSKNREWEYEWEFAQKAAWAETTQNSWFSCSQIEAGMTRDSR